MYSKFQLLKTLVTRHTILPHIQQNLKPRNQYNLNPTKYFTTTSNPLDVDSSSTDDPIPNTPSSVIDKDVAQVHNILNLHLNSSASDLDKDLDDQCRTLPLFNDDFVLQVFRRHRSDWKSVFRFFNWVCKRGGANGYSPGTSIYNEVLDVLGKMKRFEELHQVFDVMSQRGGLIDERTFAILLNRYAAAHLVKETVEIFHKRCQLGFELDLSAFQTLLLALCRYKHVEYAESLFIEKKNEYPLEIKTLNIILNGWCVLDNLHETKRFWKDILSMNCKPDRFTYGIFINALTKSGKLGTAVSLFRSMWKMDKDCNPDVVICNCVIDALCFKKRIPEALRIFEEMKERGCEPNTATYNSLIKHFCKIVRMEKVYELLDEMEEKKGSCAPSAITFHYLLNSTRSPQEVQVLLERMGRNGCLITSSTYNQILKLYLGWNDIDGVRSTWTEMKKSGVGLDWRAYTIMIHGLHKKDRVEEALRFYDEMILKGMTPEPRTNIVVTEMKSKSKERENEKGVQEMSKAVLLEVCLNTGRSINSDSALILCSALG